MLRIVILMSLMACNAQTDACLVASEGLGCDDCYDGEVTCTLDDVTVKAGSCSECQARQALTVALCNAGSTATREEIDADGICELEPL